MSSAPNFLLVCTDHWPASLLGCAGHPAIQTPTLDQIAVNGTRFSNAYSECPVCVPARRTLMTGLTPANHGLLSNGSLPMPPVPTLAQTFRDAGYQAVAVGKLHVSPQRQRLGFDDVILDEEGRGAEGCRADDYELYLSEQGHPGERFAGGMSNNEYLWRPWHLDERHHVTNWASREMCRQIIRRDPLKPGFWYLSYSHPHPPLAPLQAYLDLYRDADIPPAVFGDWAEEEAAPAIQSILQSMRNTCRKFNDRQVRDIRRAFYALATHIDHQLRVVIGTLRQEGLLGNTVLCFTSDHGDMLGDHGLWAKSMMYEGSANIPLLLSGTAEHIQSGKVGFNTTDARPTGLRDIMPTLLDLAGIEIPQHCEGKSLLSSPPRTHTFAAYGSGEKSKAANTSRMVTDGRFKLIYYPTGNILQLFDLDKDPKEQHNLVSISDHAEHVESLTRLLIAEFTAAERECWLDGDNLQGKPASDKVTPSPNVGFSGQRSYQWLT